MGGLFIIENAGAPQPIEGVATSTAAFLGETSRGPVVPRLVTSFTEFARWFGADAPTSVCFLPAAVRGFFENGGARVFIARVVAADAATASISLGPLTIRANGPGVWGNHISVATKAQNGTVQLSLTCSPTGPAAAQPISEVFDDLDLDPTSERHIGRVVGAQSVLVRADVSVGATVDHVTVVGAGSLSGGTDGAQAPDAADFEGAVVTGVRTDTQGLAAIAEFAYADVALVYAPYPRRDADAVARALVAHCETMRYRFAVVDLAETSVTGQPDPRSTIADSSFAACYAPWLNVGGPGARAVIVPPGGHVLGVYARVDRERGVFHAPANEIVQGVTALALTISNRDQDVLQPLGVNAIREFPGRGIRVWGGRTLSSDPEWKYVAIRRLFVYLERSISRGVEWAVFEPNGNQLWTRVRDTIRNFLRGQWIGGALVGRKEEEAFFIKCDRTTMTQDDLDNGRLVCLIGVAPTKPAEFVIFRIGQWTADHKP